VTVARPTVDIAGTHRPLLHDVHRNIAYAKPLRRGWLPL
jgi:hypothetical protein